MRLERTNQLMIINRYILICEFYFLIPTRLNNYLSLPQPLLNNIGGDFYFFPPSNFIFLAILALNEQLMIP